MVMLVSRVHLSNWKNFRSCDVDLSGRTFIVGANASGKSNFLDVFRFLHDVTKVGGGLQMAVANRGGMRKVRCLAARQDTAVEIGIVFRDSVDAPAAWTYNLAFNSVENDELKNKEVCVVREFVQRGDEVILNRTSDSGEDVESLTYTYLEQGASNLKFRELKNFFEDIEYLNLIPQLLRESSLVPAMVAEDYFGRDFLQRLSRLDGETGEAYLKTISEVLRQTVPQLEELKLAYDENGQPHIEMKCRHLRGGDNRQREDQLSDGTLRLIGILFAVLDSKGMVLLEEPETNLQSSVVSRLPQYISKLLRTENPKAQVLITTHSYEILSDQGIGSDEVVVLMPSAEGTKVTNASSLSDVNDELSAGFSVADAVIPYTDPYKVNF